MTTGLTPASRAWRTRPSRSSSSRLIEAAELVLFNQLAAADGNPTMPRLLGHVCRVCACSEMDACTEGCGCAEIGPGELPLLHGVRREGCGAASFSSFIAALKRDTISWHRHFTAVWQPDIKSATKKVPICRAIKSTRAYDYYRIHIPTYQWSFALKYSKGWREPQSRIGLSAQTKPRGGHSPCALDYTSRNIDFPEYRPICLSFNKTVVKTSEQERGIVKTNYAY